MNVAIIGAGVSGLACGQLLSSKGYNVRIFESDSEIGGIAKTRQVGGTTYHMVGGHCFNSKHKDVLDFVFSIYPENLWNKVDRIAKIWLKGSLISYPIEFSLKEIYALDKDLAFNIVKDLIEDPGYQKEPRNLKEWFESKFGKTLSDIYFTPYNSKIWGRDPEEMSFSWVADKLPNPDRFEILGSLFEDKKDNMPHSVFFYPKTNNQADFIKAMSEGLDISFNTVVGNVSKNESDKWVVCDSEFDFLITTAPMDNLGALLSYLPEKIIDAIGKLSYNKVSTMLWSCKESSQTWTYFPSEDTIFHRHIHIGNFFTPRKNVLITEALGAVDKDKMIKEGSKFDHLLEPLDYNVSEHAYVVYDDKYSEAKKLIDCYLSQQGVLNLGRFAEWEYYNMDVCIKSAIDLVRTFDDK